MITGPNIDVAITLIQRLKALFPPNILPDTKETVCEINGVHVQAFPSYNLKAARGLEKPILVWLDEADYFPVGQQDEATVISERYIGKSPGLAIVMTSTPNVPEGLYWNIEKLPAEQCRYHRMVMTYEVGLNKIYTPEEIAKARESPSFPREYEGQYIGQQGDVFSHESIQKAIQLGLDYHNAAEYRIDEIRQDTTKSMGIDAGFGSSKFGICITQYVPENKHKNIAPIFQVLYAEEFERPDFNDMVNLVLKLKQNYTVGKIEIDSSNPEVITSIKAGLNERTDYERQISILKQKHPRWLDLSRYMDVIPVSFAADGREMLGFTKRCVDSNWLAIHPNFHKLLVSLRRATATDGLLHKGEGQTAHNDIFDALRLSLFYFKPVE